MRLSWGLVEGEGEKDTGIWLIEIQSLMWRGLRMQFWRSALYCGLQFKFDIGRLLDARFDYCNLVWNNYLFNVSAEMLASQRLCSKRLCI